MLPTFCTFYCTFLLTFVHFLYPFVIENIHFCTKISTFCTVHTLVRVNLEISSVFLFFAHSIILSYDFFSMFRFSVFLFFTNRYKGLKIFPFLIFSSLSSGWFWALEANMSSFYLSVFVFFSVPPFFSLLLPSLLTLSLFPSVPYFMPMAICVPHLEKEWSCHTTNASKMPSGATRSGIHLIYISAFLEKKHSLK